MSDIAGRFARDAVTQRLLEAALAERDRAVWEEAEKIVDANRCQGPALCFHRECSDRKSISEALRARRRAVKYLPHAGTLISEDEAERISKDGP